MFFFHLALSGGNHPFNIRHLHTVLLWAWKNLLRRRVPNWKCHHQGAAGRSECNCQRQIWIHLPLCGNFAPPHRCQSQNSGMVKEAGLLRRMAQGWWRRKAGDMDSLSNYWVMTIWNFQSKFFFKLRCITNKVENKSTDIGDNGAGPSTSAKKMKKWASLLMR